MKMLKEFLKNIFKNSKNLKISAIVILSIIICAEIGIVINTNINRIKRENAALARLQKQAALVPDPTAEPMQSQSPAQTTAEAATEAATAAATEAATAVATAVAIPTAAPAAPAKTTSSKKVVVLDPGHGKSSSDMSSSEKASEGWVQNENGKWGAWRHYKVGSATVDCEGSGCNGRVTPNGACWYPIGNGDRDSEPNINLQNCLAAKRYLEQMGYEVRMTRTTNSTNPSFENRLAYCYPNNDRSSTPDADIFVCIHSNASEGGARGSAYISLDGTYDQKWIKSNYVSESNRLGRTINNSIVNNTSLSESGGGVISFEPELVLFMQSPVTIGYLEIGYFDNSSDLNILTTENDSIGKAIATGVNNYFNGTN